jgi:hypothetical protein
VSGCGQRLRTAVGVAGNIIGAVRRNPSTVVVLAGQPSEALLAAVGRSMNVSLVRAEDSGSARGIEAAAGALRRAAGISSPYVLVAADPLAEVAEEWRAMWEVTAQPRGGEEFELRAAEALAAWRANRFELPDYYVVLAQEATTAGPAVGGGSGGSGGSGRTGGSGGSGGGVSGDLEPRPDFYLGPLRSVRPHRVAVVAAGEPAEQTAGLLHTLGSLRHGRWWPPLDEVIDTARRFYPGSLAESAPALLS